METETDSESTGNDQRSPVSLLWATGCFYSAVRGALPCPSDRLTRVVVVLWAPLIWLHVGQTTSPSSPSKRTAQGLRCQAFPVSLCHCPRREGPHGCTPDFSALPHFYFSCHSVLGWKELKNPLLSVLRPWVKLNKRKNPVSRVSCYCVSAWCTRIELESLCT